MEKKTRERVLERLKTKGMAEYPTSFLSCICQRSNCANLENDPKKGHQDA